MRVDFGISVDVRCVGCGAELDLPIGTAERVLDAGPLFADVTEACSSCGGRRVRVEVKIDDGGHEEYEGSRPPPSGHR